jgi:xanthine dehydrogenase/oxidase
LIGSINQLLVHFLFKAGTDKDGVIQAVDMKIVSDCGGNFNEGTAFFAASFAKNCYTAKSWKFTPFLAKTDTPSNTYCRAPGQKLVRLLTLTCVFD